MPHEHQLSTDNVAVLLALTRIAVAVTLPADERPQPAADVTEVRAA